MQQGGAGGAPPNAAALSYPAGPPPAPNPLADTQALAMNLPPPTPPDVMVAPPPAGAPVLPSPAPAPSPQLPPPPAPAPAPPPRARPPGAGAGPPGLNTSAEERRLYNEQQQLQGQAVTAEQAGGEIRKKIAGIESTAADEEATRKAQAEQHQQTVIDEANKRTQQWADRAQAATDQYMKMDFHDYWADKSTGNKVLAGLSIMFGALGRTDNSTNPGLKMVNDAIERDFRMQQARIEKAKGNMAAAREGYELGLTQKQQALADNKLKEAAAYDTAAAKLVALKMKQGVSAEQAQTDKDVIALKQKGTATRLETLKEIHGQNVQDADLAIKRAHLGLEREKVKQGASALGMQRLELQRDRLVNQDLAAFDRNNNIPKALAARDKILDVKGKVDDPNATPATLASAIMEFDTAVRQGTATGASMQALQSHLAPGLFSKVQAAAAHGTGTFTDREKKELRAAVDAAVKASDEEGNRLHEAFKSRFYTDPKLQPFKDQLGAESESRFGRFGYKSDATRAREAGSGGAPAGGGGPAPSRADALQAAVARMRNPNETPERREQARAWLVSQGAPVQ